MCRPNPGLGLCPKRNLFDTSNISHDGGRLATLYNITYPDTDLGAGVLGNHLLHHHPGKSSGLGGASIVSILKIRKASIR